MIKKIKTMENFLSYNNLSSEDARLFMGTKLNHFLNDARAVLFSKKKSSYYNKVESFNHNEKELYLINSRINYILELIGQYSNARFGKTAAEQHYFFRRIREQETFFIHLCMSTQEHKKELILKENPRTKKEIDATYLHEMGHKLRTLEKQKGVYFKIENKPIKEKALYAAGVFYMMNFIFEAVKENNAMRQGILLAHMVNFKSGVSYFSKNGEGGGKKTAEKRRAKIKIGYDIFLEKKLYNEPVRKTAASKLYDELMKDKISIAYETVRTKWIPKFIKDYKQLLEKQQETESFKPS